MINIINKMKGGSELGGRNYSHLIQEVLSSDTLYIKLAKVDLSTYRKLITLKSRKGQKSSSKRPCRPGASVDSDKTSRVTGRNLKETIDFTHNRKLGKFKCRHCDFETVHRISIMNHIKIHKNLDEIESYDCHLCDYRGRTKCSLKSHLLTHLRPKEGKWYQCKKCPFKTRYKTNFRRHRIVHQGPAEATMVKCQYCDYQSKHLPSVKKHLLCHKEYEAKCFVCDVCDYETRHRNNLERHTLTHKSYGEVQMFKCEECDYITNYKPHLQTHYERQHNPTALKYRCFNCDYVTTIKGNIAKHMLQHSKPKPVKCNICGFLSKHLNSLKRHKRIWHRSNRKENMEKENKHRRKFKPSPE